MCKRILQRKTPPHLIWSTNRETLIYLTVCTDKRKRVLDNHAAHRILVSSWMSASEWLVGLYIIMPDHVHLFCTPAGRNSLPLARWVIYWKNFTTKSWPWQNDKPIWQRSYWDTTICRREHYGEKWAYVKNNPVRANLCQKSEDWPFQGEINSWIGRG